MEKGSSSQEMVQSETPRQEDKEEEVEEEEYVLLDLDSVSDDIRSIPENAPYLLSDLDTPNPILLIDNKIKLIGEYEETIGTCIVFNESDGDPIVQEEAGPSEANLTSGKCTINPKQTPCKKVNPIAHLNKVLKFRLLVESDKEDGVEKQADKPS